MTVLGIDTATSRGSVALARDGRVLAATPLLEGGGHARDLLLRIDDLLTRSGVRTADLGGVAVTLGPGSFTGVRVGLSTAKGLAYALDIGLAGLSTLEVLARAALPAAAGAPLVCAAIRAGRGEVYAALFRPVAGDVVRETEDRSCKPDALARSLPPGTRVVGDGADAVAGPVEPPAAGSLEVIEWPLLAGPLATWGCGAIEPGARYRPGEPRPNYVRPSDAQVPRR